MEDKSTNTKENAIFSKIILEHELGNENFNHLLVVITWGHMRRSILALKTYMPETVSYSICSSYPDIEQLGKKSENWDMTDEFKKE
ncbi:MAG: hypothetical protein A2Y22_01340 [Clostridiales bacterium GWD2_32_59]|nr:MAG: hypothetical protein A2Y22_01340 [Clostridiales bacterium GWD2_32_59]